MLDAGPLVHFFTTVARWLTSHPTDIVTILIGNGDDRPPTDFGAPLIDSGLNKFVYTPPTASLTLDAWPTLAEMIDANTRCVVMLDYGADFALAPWLIGEFDGTMWETPFSPTDPDFPCIAQRPPDMPRDERLSRLIMMNHNLNSNWSIGGNEVLIPNLRDIDKTNADHGKGSVGAAMDLCTDTWGRAPNFLLVDFYNRGNFALSVLSVAARANNVSWHPAQVSRAPRSCFATSKSAFAFSVLAAATVTLFGAHVES